MLIRHKHFAAFAFCLSLIVVNAIAQEKPRAETQFDEYGRWKNGVTEPWFFESKDRYTDEEVAAARKFGTKSQPTKLAMNGRALIGHRQAKSTLRIFAGRLSTAS
jgi:hypothetical protein